VEYCDMKHKSAHPLLRLSFGPYSPKCVEEVFCEVRMQDSG